MIIKAIGDLGWRIPTPIQSSSISLALSGRDIVARARTGSGKTAAFAIPLLQKLLQTKKVDTNSDCPDFLPSTCSRAHPLIYLVS